MSNYLNRRSLILLAIVWLSASLVRGQPDTPKAKPDEARTALLVRGNNEFALELYTKLADGTPNNGNVVYAPHSVTSLLGLAYSGAQAATATEMAKCLHLNLAPQHVPGAYQALNQALISEPGGIGLASRPAALTTTTALWGQTGLGIRPDFVKVAQSGFGADIREVDFRADAEKARSLINSWARAKTQGRVPQLLPIGAVSAGTEIVLANAVHFKAAWARPFPKKATEEAPFFVTADRRMTVPLMRQTGTFAYHRTKQVQLVELPYQDSDLSLVVLLPDQTVGLARLEKQLTAATLTDWLGQLKKQEVQVCLPRFRLAFDRELRDTLAGLGMRLAFRPNADFSGMTGKKNFHLSAVLHRAYFSVQEEGTEAGAVTGGIVKTGIDDLAQFRADRPFLFVLRDKRTHAILFLGRLTLPQA